MIGGGVVRDGIMGGQPNDIDVWLPSNINITSTEELRIWCRDAFVAPVEVVFSGPENVDQDGEGYRDMSNHCVLEFTDMRGFNINIMRTMTVWNNEDPSAFFRGVMRNFDIDLCMFFVAFGYEEQGIHTPHVIMPRHLVVQLNDTTGITYQIRQFCWNAHRLENMSDARRAMRSEKMHSRFMNLGPEGTIQVEEIEPQVVTVSWLMRKMQFFPFPVLPAVPETSNRDTIGLSTGRLSYTFNPFMGQRIDFMVHDEAQIVAELDEDPNAAPLPQPAQITGQREEYTPTPEQIRVLRTVRMTQDGNIDWS